MFSGDWCIAQWHHSHNPYPAYFPAGQTYRQTSPQCWTADNVLDWISDHVESTNFDASTLSLAYCTMDGPTLCQMNRDQMIGVFGLQLGPHLHQNLQEHKTKYGKTASVSWDLSLHHLIAGYN